MRTPLKMHWASGGETTKGKKIDVIYDTKTFLGRKTFPRHLAYCCIIFTYIIGTDKENEDSGIVVYLTTTLNEN